MTTQRTLGDHIKALLRERGISQSTLSELTHIRPSHLSRLISSKRTWAIDHVEAIARALDLSPAELVAQTDARALLAPNGAHVERGYMERVAGELSQAAQRVQELQSENLSLRASKEELEATVSNLSAALEDDRTKLQREERRRKVAEDDARSSSKEASRLKNTVSILERQLREVQQQNQQLRDNLGAAHQQITANYDAYQQEKARGEALALELMTTKGVVQAEAQRAHSLQKKLGEANGNTAVAALFGGLLGIGLGASAVTSSPGRRRRT